MKRVLHQKRCDCFAHKQIATVTCLFRRRQRTCEHLLGPMGGSEKSATQIRNGDCWPQSKTSVSPTCFKKEGLVLICFTPLSLN